ncbi:HTH-type transcriptional regulator YidZ [Streptomyces alboniger]
MNLASLDLNLVVALRALLEERNVTNAGRRIGLSQPAMSAALARLRRHFGDDLLSRVGGHYELTALGLALLARTATACDLLERVFTSQAVFDPAREEHEFTLIASDYAVAVFGAELARTAQSRAALSGTDQVQVVRPVCRTGGADLMRGFQGDRRDKPKGAIETILKP